MINYFEELMSEEYRSYLKYETLMEDEELASMFDIPELSRGRGSCPVDQ